MTAIPTSEDLLARMKDLHPLMIDLSLERIERLLVKLGSPECALPPVIHIAGTNGKGSTLAFLKAMFEAGGKSVAAYTSPHLVRFHERITLPHDGRREPGMEIGVPGAAATHVASICHDNTGVARADEIACGDARSNPIAERDLARYLHKVLMLNDGAPITYFEITTAAALLAIADSQAEIFLLEVGLGGRFDTTNVVAKPAICVITPVSMDHADKLGNTVAKIAREKAGILKPGVRAVIAQQTDEALAVIEEVAAKVGAPLLIWGRDFDCYEQNGRLVFQREDRVMDLPLPALHGRHQVRNAGLAIACVLALRSTLDPNSEASATRIDDDAIECGLICVQWPARLQRLADGPLLQDLNLESELWLDGGHNEAAGQALAQAAADLEDRAPKPLVLVVGMMGAKDARGFLAPFGGLARHVIAVPIAKMENDLGDSSKEAESLAGLAREMGFKASHASDPAAAVKDARAIVDGPVRILICGSLYLAGQVLASNS